MAHRAVMVEKPKLARSTIAASANAAGEVTRPAGESFEHGMKLSSARYGSKRRKD